MHNPRAMTVVWVTFTASNWPLQLQALLFFPPIFASIAFSAFVNFTYYCFRSFATRIHIHTFHFGFTPDSAPTKICVYFFFFFFLTINSHWWPDTNWTYRFTNEILRFSSLFASHEIRIYLFIYFLFFEPQMTSTFVCVCSVIPYNCTEVNRSKWIKQLIYLILCHNFLGGDGPLRTPHHITNRKTHTHTQRETDTKRSLIRQPVSGEHIEVGRCCWADCTFSDSFCKSSIK